MKCIFAGLGCCGRAAISKGLSGRSPAAGRCQHREADAVGWVHGAPIVGCEPSCLLTLVDEYVDLVPGPAAKHWRARQCSSKHSWHAIRLRSSAASIAGGSAKLIAVNAPGLVHGHCHQKAIVGMHDTLVMLAPLCRTAPTLLDSGCCGMAGSFGCGQLRFSYEDRQPSLVPRDLPGTRGNPHRPRLLLPSTNSPCHRANRRCTPSNCSPTPLPRIRRVGTAHRTANAGWATPTRIRPIA